MSALPGKLLLPCLISACAMTAAAQEKINFYRPVKAGEVYDCGIKTEFRETIEVTNGLKRQPPKVNYLKIELTGKLAVTKASDAPYPAEADLTVANFSMSNGAETSLLLKAGAVITINFQGKKPEFSSKPAPLGDDAEYALSMIFTNPRNKTISDLLGKEKDLAAGNRWALGKAPFIAEFRKGGFTVAPEDLKAEACLVKKTKTDGFDCWEISLDAETKNVENLKFKYSSTMFLPVDDARSGTVIYSRETFTSVKKTMPEDNPLSAGLNVNVETVEKTSSSSIKINGTDK